VGGPAGLIPAAAALSARSYASQGRAPTIPLARPFLSWRIDNVSTRKSPMPIDKPTPRVQQQPPRRDSDQQQQQAGTTDFQPKGAQPRTSEQAGGGKQVHQQQMGEGSYEATRDYQKDIGEYLENADVEADAKAARPRSEQEAHDLEQAEKEGKSHSKGEH
jgi:hypothetical protein